MDAVLSLDTVRMYWGFHSGNVQLLRNSIPLNVASGHQVPITANHLVSSSFSGLCFKAKCTLIKTVGQQNFSPETGHFWRFLYGSPPAGTVEGPEVWSDAEAAIPRLVGERTMDWTPAKP